MLKPILHSIRNQPMLWGMDSDHIWNKGPSTYVTIHFGKRYRMTHPVDKYLTFWEKKALNRTIKYWKKKKIQKAAKQVNATQHQGRN